MMESSVTRAPGSCSSTSGTASAREPSATRTRAPVGSRRNKRAAGVDRHYPQRCWPLGFGRGTGRFAGSTGAGEWPIRRNANQGGTAARCPEWRSLGPVVSCRSPGTRDPQMVAIWQSNARPGTLTRGSRVSSPDHVRVLVRSNVMALDFPEATRMP
jgi:hypothetical protein